MGVAFEPEAAHGFYGLGLEPQALCVPLNQLFNKMGCERRNVFRSLL